MQRFFRLGKSALLGGFSEMTLTDSSESDRYRLLVEAVTDYAIYMLDAEGNVASWNPGAKRFKGYDDREIIGQHFSRFYTQEDKATGLPERALQIADREGRFENEGWRSQRALAGNADHPGDRLC